MRKNIKYTNIRSSWGLHFPVDGDSEKYMGYYITGKLPWVPFTLNDVNKKIGLIKNEI